MTGDWYETRQRLRELSRKMRAAIDAGDNDAAFDICVQILGWVGDRNPSVGALPFLSTLHGDGVLTSYLSAARRLFALTDAQIDRRRPQTPKMNAMIAKVIADAALDGLPIYDSRVAAAIAALIELWRRSQALSVPLTPELAFPAMTSGRTVLHRFDDAPHPGVMSYAPAKAAETATQWGSAQIRLGWLLSALLDKAPALFASVEAKPASCIPWKLVCS